MSSADERPDCLRCGQPVTITHTSRGTERIYAHKDTDGRPCRPATAGGVRIEEIQIERENGDTDTLHLCAGCLPSIDDFATVKVRRKISGSCDRCGARS